MLGHVWDLVRKFFRAIKGVRNMRKGLIDSDMGDVRVTYIPMSEGPQFDVLFSTGSRRRGCCRAPGRAD